MSCPTKLYLLANSANLVSGAESILISMYCGRHVLYTTVSLLILAAVGGTKKLYNLRLMTGHHPQGHLIAYVH